MDLFQAIVLGVLQGLTEFLPVSSSGHLAILHYFFGAQDEHLSFDIMVHMGTALSVIVVYRQALKKIFADFFKSVRYRQWTQGSRIVVFVVIGSFITGIIGISFKSHFEQAFTNLYIVMVGFVITSILLFATKNKPAPKQDYLNIEGETKLNPWRAAIIGFSQALAILPGISRSGTTIAVGLFVGLDRREAAMFSFLLAIPAIFGAGLIEFSSVEHINQQMYLALAAGFISSFCVGYLALKLLLRFVQKGHLHFFSYYLLVLAALLFVVKIMET